MSAMSTDTGARTSTGGVTTPPRVLPQSHLTSRIIGWVAAALAVAFLVTIALNENFRWHIVGEYFFAANIQVGIVNTILLTVISMVVGTLLGAVLALMKLAPAKSLQAIADAYIWFFRGIPLLVQLLFWFNMAALFPQMGLSVPALGIEWLLNTNALISPFMAAVLALTLHEAAYMAEIIRSGILSIDKGQSEAAGALAMNPRQVMVRIVLPQAMRVIIPPTGNQVISMLKTTSLVSVIALNDLLYSAQVIYSSNYQVIPLLLVASIWYLIMVSVLTFFQGKLEAHYGKGYTPRKVRKTMRKKSREQS